MDVIKIYLEKVQSKQMSKEELESIARTYATDNSLGKSDIGKMMSYFKSNYDGQYDGKELSLIVKSIL